MHNARCAAKLGEKEEKKTLFNLHSTNFSTLLPKLETQILGTTFTYLVFIHIHEVPYLFLLNMSQNNFQHYYYSMLIHNKP